jgi:hypothetical protein
MLQSPRFPVIVHEWQSVTFRVRVRRVSVGKADFVHQRGREETCEKK